MGRFASQRALAICLMRTNLAIRSLGDDDHFASERGDDLDGEVPRPRPFRKPLDANHRPTREARPSAQGGCQCLAMCCVARFFVARGRPRGMPSRPLG